MWNQFLNESKSERKFENTPILVLGNKHSGKRSLVDSLFDISKTSLYSKKSMDTNKMRLKGLTSIIDYAYLNVLDLYDPDYRTHSKLEIYFVEDQYDAEVFSRLQKPQLLKKAIVIIMLDFTNPWSFMDDLNSWIKFLYELQKSAGFSITELQQMANDISNYYKGYKEPEFDENGKIKKDFGKQQDQTQLELPLPDGVLTNNIRMPFLVCVNKSDLQSSVLRDESTNKIQFILYHIRKFCIQYGGSLIYTSIKNNSNLNVLYEYLLHRAYKMPLKFKAQLVNEEAIFIPFGFDNLNIIQDSVLKMDVSKSYSDMIPAPVNKRSTKQQITLEEDAQFFKKHIGTSAGTPNTTTINSSSVRDESSVSSNPRTTEVTEFFERLLRSNNSNNNNTGANEQQRRSEAQNTLLKYTMQAENNKSKKDQ